jgi:hypothetical protein
MAKLANRPLLPGKKTPNYSLNMRLSGPKFCLDALEKKREDSVTPAGK